MTYLEAIADEIQRTVHVEAGRVEERVLYLHYAVLALAKGVETNARDVHDAWVAWMVGLGRSHPSMVPFEELSSDVQDEDLPFVQAIRVVAGRFAGPR